MNEQKLKEVFSDEDFVASILEMETAEEVQKALSEKGVEISLNEIEAIKNSLANSATEGELSEDQLEDVSGGSLTAVVCAVIIGGAAAGGAYSLGKKINEWTRRRW